MTDGELQRVRGLRRRRSNGLLKVLLALFGVVLVVAGVAAYLGWATFLKPDHAIASGRPVEVAIKRGSGTSAIADTLSEAGVIRNAMMFRWTARKQGVDGKLKPGQYSLSTGMPDELVLEKLQKGPNIVFYDVPIPEGFTAAQIAARFAKRADVSEAEMLALVKSGAPQFADEHPYLKGAYNDSLEGYLFPKTYRIKKGTKPEQIVEKMLDQFDTEIAKVDLSYAESKNLDVKDVVTIASIIEREARIVDERPLVASVIYNRLHERMRLQLCATVLYEMPKGSTRVTYDDTRRDGPYNTYTRSGLPVGPISNPGAASLRAAAKPKQTKYLYYVLTGKDGSQTFTETYSEFQAAVRKNREVFAK